MYASHFDMKELPFVAEPDARFIVLSGDHHEALATLVYAIDQQEGWALLLGEPGMGKTTLIMALLRELRDRVIPAVITNPNLDVMDFYNLVALELGLEGPFASKGQFIMALSELMQGCRARGRVVMLVVDEAQSLKPAMLEELRLLGNLDDQTPRVLNIFLVAQPELLRLLKQPESRGLLQRLRRHHVIKPMSPKETAAYIRHRLTVAGGDKAIFDARALATVYQLTRGVPRLVNSLCDDALLLAYTRDNKNVDRQMVLDAARDNQLLDYEPVEAAPVAAPAASAPAPEPAAPPPPPADQESVPTVSVEAEVGPDADLMDLDLIGYGPQGPAEPGPQAEQPARRPRKELPDEGDEIVFNLEGRGRTPRHRSARKGKASGEPDKGFLSQKGAKGVLRRLLLLLLLTALAGAAYWLSGHPGVRALINRFDRSGRPALYQPPPPTPAPRTAPATPAPSSGGAPGGQAPQRQNPSSEGR